MQARDIMTTHVVTIGPNASVKELADLLLNRSISAVPVVGPKDEVIGIVSEGDLMRRAELGTKKVRPWWLRLLSGEHALAADFIKANAQKVGDVMTREVVTASAETPLAELAQLMERHSIKRIPITKNRQLVGIVSRANLVQCFASLQKKPHLEISPADSAIRGRIMERLDNEPWAHTSLLNVIVNEGIVDLWGIVHTAIEKDAIRVAAESTKGVRAVNNHLVLRPIQIAT